MPNGFYRSEKDWQRLEAPLRALDDELEAFAARHQLEFSRNYHNWPERSLRWHDGIHRHVQVWLADEHQLTLNVSASAWQDRGTSRYWKNQILLSAAPLPELQRDLDGLLVTAVRLANSWVEQDLEFATALS